jgi:hypothetical protein
LGRGFKTGFPLISNRKKRKGNSKTKSTAKIRRYLLAQAFLWSASIARSKTNKLYKERLHKGALIKKSNYKYNDEQYWNKNTVNQVQVLILQVHEIGNNIIGLYKRQEDKERNPETLRVNGESH